MNKKEYIKPIAKQVVIANGSLLAGSPEKGEYAGDDGGSGETEAKGNDWTWDD